MLSEQRLKIIEDDVRGGNFPTRQEILALVADSKEYRAALKFIADCGSEDWARLGMTDDHFCSLDHKDEMALSEAVLLAHLVLRGDPEARAILKRC